MKKKIINYLNNEIEPIYDNFMKTKNTKIIKGLNEKIEVLQLMLDELYNICPLSADDFYMRNIGVLPNEESLIIEVGGINK